MGASHSMSQVCPSLHYSRVMEHRAVYWREILLLSQHSGGSVVHSYGRLIPHEFPITDLQQISGPDGIRRITCIVSSGTAKLMRRSGVPETDGVIQTTNTMTAILMLLLNSTDNFHNRHLYCSNPTTNYFYLFISDTSELIVSTLLFL